MHIHTHFSKHPTSLIILMVTFPQVHSLTHSLTHTQYHTLTLTNSLILSVSLYVSFTDILMQMSFKARYFTLTPKA